MKNNHPTYTSQDCMHDMRILLPRALRSLHAEGILDTCGTCGESYLPEKSSFLYKTTPNEDGGEGVAILVCEICMVKLQGTAKDEGDAAPAPCELKIRKQITVPGDEMKRRALVSALAESAIDAVKSDPAFDRKKEIAVRPLRLHAASWPCSYPSFAWLGHVDGPLKSVPFIWRESDPYVVQGGPVNDAVDILKALESGHAEVMYFGPNFIITNDSDIGLGA